MRSVVLETARDSDRHNREEYSQTVRMDIVQSRAIWVTIYMVKNLLIEVLTSDYVIPDR